MASDPEVNIKFNADSGDVPPAIDRLQALFDELTRRVEESDAAMQDMSGDVRRVSEAAGFMKRTAQDTGNADVKNQVERAFQAGAGTVQLYEEKLGILEGRMQSLQEKAQGVMAAVQDGSMSYDAAIARMEKLNEKVSMNAESVGELGERTSAAMFELGQAKGLEGALRKYEDLLYGVNDASKVLEITRGVLERMQSELEAHKASLDENSAGYEKQVAEVMQAEAALQKYADRLDQIDAQLSKQERGLGKAFGTPAEPVSSDKAYEALEKEESAMDKLKAKMLEIETSVELSAQKRAAAQEQAAQKAEAAAQREAAAQEQAAQKAEEAAQREAAAQEAAAYAMQLAGLSKRKLAEETRRLIAERKKAAAAGDAEAYARLTARLGQCRTAMRSVTQAAQVNKIAMMQQAQTAAMMGGQIQSIGGQIAGMGEAAKNGSLNVTGLATSFISLSMALKAGMGPLGWVLLVLEGLQAAWNYFASSAKKAREEAQKNADAMKNLADAERKVQAAAEEMGRSLMKSELSRLAETADAATEKLKGLQEAARLELKVNQETADMAAEIDRKKRQDSISLAMEELENERKLGKVSQDEYIRRKEELEEKGKAIEDEAAREKAERRLENAEAEKRETAQSLKDIVAQQQALRHKLDDKVAPLLENKAVERVQQYEEKITQDNKEIEAKINKLKAERDSVTDEGLQNALDWQITDLTNKISNNIGLVNKEWGLLAQDLKMSVKELRSNVGKAKEFREADKELDAKRTAAEAAVDAADADVQLAKKAKDNLQEEQKHDDEVRSRRRDIAKALRDEQEHRAKELEKVQRTGSLADQKDVLLAQREQMVKGSEEWKKYTAQIRSINEKMRQEKLSELARTHAPEEVRAELERLRARCKEGSDAWKRYTDQIRRLEVQGIREGLEKYKRELEISTTYQKQDSRTQAEIYRADRRKLAALVSRLRADIAATDDYALRRSLQEELRQTLEQQKNLRAATAKSAQEALKELTQREQENREAKNSRSRRAMETAHKRYEAAVREAAKLTLAATKANNDAERRILMEKARREQEKANKYGAKEEKYAKDPAAVRKQIDANNENLKTMREEGSARRAAADQKRKSSRAEKAASDATIAAERKRAAEAGKNATTPQGQQAPAAQSAAAQQAAAAAQQAAAQAAQATAALTQLTTAIQGLSTTHGSLLTAVTQAAQTLETLASVTQSALADTARRLKTAEDKITRLLEKAR